MLVIQASATGVMLAGKVHARDSFDDFVYDQFMNYGNNTDSDFNATSFVDTIQETVSAVVVLLQIISLCVISGTYICCSCGKTIITRYSLLYCRHIVI